MYVLRPDGETTPSESGHGRGSACTEYGVVRSNKE